MRVAVVAEKPSVARDIARVLGATHRAEGCLAGGGYVVDTPGVRQFQLWDVIPEEVPAYFRDLRPYINHCKFPNCTHIHETDCAVKDAVADGRLDLRRYDSYCHLFAGDME